MKLVILDRDGTINDDRDDFVKSPDEWGPLPGALEAIARLNHAGWHVVVATNQSGLGRGLFDMATLNAIHAQDARVLAEVGGRIDAVFFCPHAPDDGCDAASRSPACSSRSASATASTCAERAVVGDSLRDLQAGAAVGCEPHLVLTGKGGARSTRRELAARAESVPDTRVHDDLRRLRRLRCCTRARRARRRAPSRTRLFGALRWPRPRRVPLGAVRPVDGRHRRALGASSVLVYSIFVRGERAVLDVRRLAAAGDLGRARDLRRAHRVQGMENLPPAARR